jgi:PAS domain S-box-containing protein
MIDRPIHILLVVDEGSQEEVIRRAFDSAAELVTLTSAPTLHEARRHLATFTPDLLIADFRLPDGTGIEFIPKEQDSARYPVLIMSSQGDENAAVAAIKAGALDCVVKSPKVFSGMVGIVSRSLREWGHILERRRAEAAVKLNQERLEALFKISQTPWRTEEELIGTSLEEGVRLTESKAGYLHFYDEQRQTISTTAWSNEVLSRCTAEKITHYPLKDAGIWADSIRRRRPVVHNDYASEPDKRGFPEGHFPLVRHMSVPIMDGESIIGIAGVGNKQDPYDEADVLQLSLFMNSMWSILKQRRSEAELRRSKDEWEKTFDAIGDVATIQDKEMRIIRVNRAACNLLGTPPDKLIGKYCYEVFRGARKPCQGCPEARTITDQVIHSAEIFHERLGKTFWVTSAPVFDEHQTFRGVVHTAKDISEQRKLEAQLRQTQKMEAIGTLAGGIAHDFNNILTPILGYAELVREELPKGSQAWINQGEIVKAGIRAKELVQQILTISRRSELEQKPIQITHIVKEALKLLRSSIPTTIEIRQKIDPNCGLVMADPTQIHQVIMNLCTNAYQAMVEEGGVLGVTLTEVKLGPEVYPLQLHLQPGRYLKLEISDTGHGIPAEIRERIFEPYFTTKADKKGTGLGLAVVHGIVQAHHGHITVYSESGYGTTFHVYLPRIETAETSQSAEPEKGIARGTERILLVDDEVVICRMEHAMLSTLGYQVTALSSSVDSLEAFRAHPDDYDLVITDMTMPNMTGSELAQRIMRIRSDVPIILCTGFSELINEEKAKSLGIRGFIMKPVDMKNLANTVRRVLDEG